MRQRYPGAKQFRMDGVVLGILREDANIDVERTKMLVEFAHPAGNLSLGRSISLRPGIRSGQTSSGDGFCRILTSGGE